MIKRIKPVVDLVLLALFLANLIIHKQRIGSMERQIDGLRRNITDLAEATKANTRSIEYHTQSIRSLAGLPPEAPR